MLVVVFSSSTLAAPLHTQGPHKCTSLIGCSSKFGNCTHQQEAQGQSLSYCHTREWVLLLCSTRSDEHSHCAQPKHSKGDEEGAPKFSFRAEL